MIKLLPHHYHEAHSRFRGNTVMFIPITAVLPSRLSLLPPLSWENISVCPHYCGITADYRGIIVVPITVQLSTLYLLCLSTTSMGILCAKHIMTIHAAIGAHHVSETVRLTDRQTARHYVSISCAMLCEHSGQKCMEFAKSGGAVSSQ